MNEKQTVNATAVPVRGAVNDPLVVPDLIPGRVLGGRFQVIWPFSSRARSGWRFATFELVLDSERTLRAYEIGQVSGVGWGEGRTPTQQGA